MEISELKKAVHKDLTVQKEKERLERVEKNKNLKKIIVYTREKSPTCENLKKLFTDEGIKFEEKSLNDHKEILTIVQTNMIPIIYTNDNYLDQGRDFQTPNQAVTQMQHFANPNFTNPPMDVRLFESIKNLNYSIGKAMQGINRQLQPIVKIMNEISQEEKNEQKDN